MCGREIVTPGPPPPIGAAQRFAIDMTLDHTRKRRIEHQGKGRDGEKMPTHESTCQPHWCSRRRTDITPRPLP